MEFLLPDLGEGLAEAEIVEWHVAVGDMVEEDQPLVDVETDKAILTIPAPATGAIARIVVDAGQTAEVGALLVVISRDGEAPAAPTADDAATPTTLTTVATTAGPGAVPAGRTLAAPAVRRLARELGIDLQRMAGTGANGRVVRQDVEQAASAASARAPISTPAPSGATAGVPSADDQRRPLRGLRRTIAKTMTQSWSTVPHIFDFRRADATRLLEVRRLLKSDLAARGFDATAASVTVTPILMKIVSQALLRHPDLNASIDENRGEIVVHGAHHIGIATSTDAGLLVPVVRHVEQRSITELAAEVAAVVGRARARTLTREELIGGTYTVNNFGALGTWLATPLIRPPEAGNAGFGRIDEDVLARDGRPVVVPVLPVSISADHRLVDGDVLASFARTIVELVEQPALLIGGLR